MPSEQEWRENKRRVIRGGLDPQFIAVTTRPDVMAATLEARAFEPDFGVQLGFVDLWAGALMLRDNPGWSSAFRTDGPNQIHEYDDALAKTRPIVLDSLKRALPAKTGLAHEMTADAIRELEAAAARPR